MDRGSNGTRKEVTRKSGEHNGTRMRPGFRIAFRAKLGRSDDIVLRNLTH